jgi:hypothetical protein
MGESAIKLVGPIIFTGLAVASWALRPSTRRDIAPSSAAHFCVPVMDIPKSFDISPIGYVHSTLKERSGAPRQGWEGAPNARLETRHATLHRHPAHSHHPLLSTL